MSETVVLAARRTPIAWVHLESNQIGHKDAWVTATPGATPVCAPENPEDPKTPKTPKTKEAASVSRAALAGLDDVTCRV